MVLFQSARSNILNETINKSATNVFLNSSANCGQNNSIIQQLSISDIKSQDGCGLEISDISQYSMQAPKFTCTSDTANETDLMAKFKTELEQNAKSVVS